MRFIVLVSGVVCLFLNSLFSVNVSQKTNQTYSTKVCFEQREFDLLKEFENTETNLIFSFKQISKYDKKRTSDSTGRFSNYQFKYSSPVVPVQSIAGTFLNLLFIFNKPQSLLQVFLL
jgi:hypothetical protein